MYSLKFILTLCFFSVITSGLLGDNNIQFYNLNEEYGVSFRQTNNVCSDDNGFIWISSKFGIIRYTQDDIRTYELPYETADVIHVNLIYKNGLLFAYANNGQIFKYSSVKDKFERVINISKELRNPYIYVSSLLVDEEDKIWISTTIGLFSYHKDDGLRAVVQNIDIQGLTWFDDHRFFYGVDKEIKLYNIQSASTEGYYQFQENPNFRISRLQYDSKIKTLWVGTVANGFYYIYTNQDDKTLQQISDVPNQPVLAIEAISDSTMLLGVDGQGIWEINYYKKEVTGVYKDDSENPYSLKGNGVYDIYRDKNERIWICTYSGGVSFFDQGNTALSKINHIANNVNSLVDDDVNSVLEDKHGNWWFATNNGISFWDKKVNKWKSFFHNKKEQSQVFLSLCEDNNGHIWAGTYSSGIYLIDTKTRKVLTHYCSEDKEVDFSNNFVFNIIKDSKGDIWIGGVQGDLVCYRTKENRFISYPDVVCYLMVEYDDKYLLIGTTYGLLLFNKESGESENLIEGHVVYDIYCDKNGFAWVATSGDGLLKYDIKNGEKLYFTTDSGLPSNFVNSIEHAGDYLWIGTEQGLCRLDEKTNKIISFNSILELNNSSYNQNSHFKLRDGRLIWGTNKGAIVFDPNEIMPNQEQGKIFLQDLTISGRSVRELDKLNLNTSIDSLDHISLKYFQNTINMEMIPIGIASPGSKFSWKLEGLDEDWSKPTSNRMVAYSNLPSGDYELKIRMINSSNSSVIDERTIGFEIIPPYWKKWWFRLLVLTVIGAIGVSLFEYYIYRLKKEHSEEKIKFFANTAHDIRTSLTLINGPIEELNKEAGLSEKAAYYLCLATEQTHRLLKVVTQLMDFQKVDIGKEYVNMKMYDIVKCVNDRVMMFESYAKSKNIVIYFESNVDEFLTAFDDIMIEKVIDNLISNAIKYAYPDSCVDVRIVCNERNWILEVRDKGIGISKPAQKLLFNEYYRGENAVNSKLVGSGIGLLLVKNYVQLHKGKVSCVSQQNIGSTFQISIPHIKLDKVNIIPSEVDLNKSHIINAQIENSSPIVYHEEDVSEALKMKVLVVEDNDYLREFLKTSMGSQFEVSLAVNGEIAWSIIQKELPDLIVSDIMMPHMDGFELCKKLKETYETSHIPIILLTSLSDKTEQLKGLGLGADDYLTKPFDVTLLQQRIKSLIQNREIIRKRALKVIKYNNTEEEVISDNKLNDDFIKRMVEVVKKNISNSSFSKDDFASEMNVSSSLLYKKVKSLTDQSPTDFIKSIRLDHSLELLQTKKNSITEISELCGFSSVGYFSTVFRKNYGKSPSQI